MGAEVECEHIIKLVLLLFVPYFVLDDAVIWKPIEADSISLPCSGLGLWKVLLNTLP